MPLLESTLTHPLVGGTSFDPNHFPYSFPSLGAEILSSFVETGYGV